MAITIERCPHCGTPYMSALLPGESPADRMCDNCNKRAGDPKNAAATAPKPVVKAGPVDDDLMLQPVLDDAPAAAAVTTHKAPNARDQIVGQIQAKAGPAIPGLPADAPMYEAPPRLPWLTVASGIRLAILLVVLAFVSNFVYGVYRRTFDAPITPTPPPPATPTVADMTKPPATPADAAKPTAAPMLAKPPEKKPDVAASNGPKSATPPAKPKELGTEGGMSDNNDVKAPPKSGPGDVNDLLSTDSRKRSRTNDDEDPDPAKPVVKAPPPSEKPGSKPVPPANKDDGEQKDPMVALLEKNKANANQPPPSNNPSLPPGANQPPRQPVGPNAPGQPPQNQKPKSLLPEGPITASVPQVIPPPPNAFNGVTFLMNYQGWLCKDFDDAHSLRESFFYNRENVIMLTPAGRTPAKLIALVEIPKSAGGKKPELILEVTNKDAVHTWMLRGTIEGAEVLRQTEIKMTDPKKPWQEIHIDLSNYIDRRFLIELDVMPPTANGALPLDHAGYIRNPHLNWKK